MNNDVNFTVISPNFLNLQKDCLFKLGPNYFWYVIKEWKPIGPLRTNLASSIGRDRTVQLFGTTGQKFLHCPGTKGQWDKLKILPRDGTGWDFDRLSRPIPSRDVPWDKNERKNLEKGDFFFWFFFFLFFEIATKCFRWILQWRLQFHIYHLDSNLFQKGISTASPVSLWNIPKQPRERRVKRIKKLQFLKKQAWKLSAIKGEPSLSILWEVRQIHLKKAISSQKTISGQKTTSNLTKVFLDEKQFLQKSHYCQKAISGQKVWSSLIHFWQIWSKKIKIKRSFLSFL